ncbi:MAG: hypothetical protein PHX04_03670 [Bacilli bacterium]|nr:hypothetical protein [Bacilli bacterium]
MDKKVVRKNTKKTVPKKSKKIQTKKDITPPPKKKIATTKKVTPVKKVIEKASVSENQKDKAGGVVILILIVLLLLSIIGTHFINLYYVKPVSEADYKYNSILVSYEELVRSPKEYKNKDIKVIGEVIKVEGVDSSYGNDMTITIDGNLFSGDYEQLITFKYIDLDYEIGFIEGDIITVYGNYKSINGNVPFIEAKYVVFGS